MIIITVCGNGAYTEISDRHFYFSPQSSLFLLFSPKIRVPVFKRRVIAAEKRLSRLDPHSSKPWL